jgi:hypothetical protein
MHAFAGHLCDVVKSPPHPGCTHVPAIYADALQNRSCSHNLYSRQAYLPVSSSPLLFQTSGNALSNSQRPIALHAGRPAPAEGSVRAAVPRMLIWPRTALFMRPWCKDMRAVLALWYIPHTFPFFCFAVVDPCPVSLTS